jgi:hypothetical protein
MNKLCLLVIGIIIGIVVQWFFWLIPLKAVDYVNGQYNKTYYMTQLSILDKKIKDGIKFIPASFEISVLPKDTTSTYNLYIY